MGHDRPFFIEHKPVPQGSILLGRNQQQGASELQAGARAILTPSPLTMALSSRRGRLVYQTAKFLISHPGFPGYIALRIPLAKHVIQGAIPYDTQHPIIVELDSGFSHLNVLLAQEIPHATVIGVDTPEVIQKRMNRLRNAILPPNLEHIAADLTQTSLLDILDGRKPDIINFTSAYYRHDELQQILAYFHTILTPTGKLAIYMPWKPGVDTIQATARFFKNQIGDYPGIVETEAQVKAIIERTPFTSHTIIYPSKYAPQQNPLDVEIMVLVKR